MKVSITLGDKETKGIKAYLESVGEPTNKKSIQQFINGIVETTLQSPHEAVFDYINN